MSTTNSNAAAVTTEAPSTESGRTVVAAEAPKPFGGWPVPDGTNIGILKLTRGAVMAHLGDGGAAFPFSAIVKATEVGDHYTALALASLEHEATIIKFKGQSAGKGTAPWMYRRPSPDEVKRLEEDRVIVGLVKEALPGATVTVHGVTAPLRAIAKALGII